LVPSLKMADTKTAHFVNGVEDNAYVELNAALATPATQESANSQKLEVGLAEMISRWPDSVR
jgi:hypothetical protein